MFPCLKTCSHFQVPADSFDAAQRKAQRSRCPVTVLGCSELPAGRGGRPDQRSDVSAVSRPHVCGSAVTVQGGHLARPVRAENEGWRHVGEALSKARNLATVVVVVQTVGLTFAVCEDQCRFEICEYLFKGQFQSKSAWGCFCPDTLGLKE